MQGAAQMSRDSGSARSSKRGRTPLPGAARGSPLTFRHRLVRHRLRRLRKALAALM